MCLKLPPNRSLFLWGPRKVGKSYWLHHHFSDTVYIDLLNTDVFARFASQPSLLREHLAANPDKLVIIDEIQKIPVLLDEVHWLIENAGRQFILTGSSARKLKRGQANLLGGRAWRRVMTPLSFMEVKGFDLQEVLHSGLLPPHFLSPDPSEDLRSYVADYLKEEIVAEAQVQNLPAFADFLRVAAITSGELLDYTNVASECGVAARVVRQYFQILEDTYLGFRVSPWTKSRERRMILTEKFYLFDVGVANFLGRSRPQIGSREFGKSFEHYILMELRAYQAYRAPDMEIKFWRTSNGQEVDFILGDKDVAIEIKGGKRVTTKDIQHLKTLTGDGPVKHRAVVCLETQKRVVGDGIVIWPYQEFLRELWGGKIIENW